MAQVGLKRASELTGRNPSTIHRAMRAGRLSYTTSLTGERLIDVAELARVFPLLAPNGADGDAVPVAPDVHRNDAQVAELRAQLEGERAKSALLAETVADLRARLDAEAAERRQAQARLTALLERPAAPSSAVVPVRRWWPFGRAGRAGS